ncbi:MAG: hypothetical protein LUG26_07195 [Ruminococcus sp.]|nr:hypothetical protein [Ruminococcus sp.]
MINYDIIRAEFNFKDFIVFFNSGKDDSYTWLCNVISSFGVDIILDSVSKYVKGQRTPNTNREDSLKNKLDNINTSYISGYPNERIDFICVTKLYEFLQLGKEADAKQQLYQILVFLASKDKDYHSKGMHIDEGIIERIIGGSYRDSFDDDVKNAAKRWFDAKKRSGRYKGYFETWHDGTPIHNLKNKLAVDESGEYSLFEILFPENEEHKNSVNLCGRGGSEKTYQIFHCIEDIFNNTISDDENNSIDASEITKNVIPIYIPLNSLEDCSGNCITYFLSKEVWHSEKTPEEIDRILNQYSTDILIFADGLNEITVPNMRKRIARDICNLRQMYKTRFLVSSRIDHTDIFNSLNYGSDQIFTKASVLELPSKQIDKYFADVGCATRYKEVPSSTRRLLKTPQGCVMFADYVGNDRERASKIESLGQLISDYSKRLLNINSDNQKIVVENVLKKIAHYMLLNDSFKITRIELDNLLNENERNLLFNDGYNIESVFSSNKSSSLDLFEFSHQNFRDNYCAQAFSDKLKAISSSDKLISTLEEKNTFVNNNITTNDEILELVSSFIDGDTIQKIIGFFREKQGNIIKTYGRNFEFSLSVLIRTFAFSHGNCLAELDLSKLNLTQISLNGYELFNREGSGCIKLDEATIGSKTFLKSGLQTASSAICKYELNGKTYIAAFAVTTAMIIDIEENQVEIISDMPYFGWVNEAVPKMYNGQMCIFLGCENGSVAIFYPYKEKEFEKKFLFRLRMPNTEVKGKIETILFPIWDGHEYIVFCNSNGDVFYRKLAKTDSDYEIISLCDNENELNEISKKFKGKSWNITCHLTLKGKSTVLAAFGNEIYYLKYDNITKSVSKNIVNINRRRENPYLFFDIHATSNYIFVNEGILVSVIAYSRKLNIMKTEICIFEISDTLSDNIVRHYYNKNRNNDTEFYFNKFSDVHAEMYEGRDEIEAVLVGIEAYHFASYDHLPQFFEIGMKNGKIDIDSLAITEIRNEQKDGNTHWSVL